MRKTLLILLVSFATPFHGRAQPVSVGVLGGVPITSGPSASDESRPYVVGPSVEVRLPAGFAVEVDALYRRLGNSFSTYVIPEGAPPTGYNYRERGNSWEFPILAKYYFRPRTARWQPFLGTGYSFHTVSQETTVSILSFSDLRSTNSTAHSHLPLNVGATFAAGVRFGAGRLSVLPQFRYTRWGNAYSNSEPKNRVDFMVGIRF